MPVYLFLGMAVVFITLGQVLQKLAVDRCDAGLEGKALLINAAHRPELWAAIACLGIGLLAWLMVLRSMDVSKAFPFLSMTQVIVLLIARFHFDERLPLTRWLGALLIFVGIALVSAT